MRKFSSLLVILILLFVLTGCNNKTENTSNTMTKNVSKNNTVNNTVNQESKKETVDEIDYEAAAKEQMAMPKPGETIAILHIKDFGDIKVRFFENIAPKAVENFVTHSKNGYYDGLTFHRVINEFMIQGGDPLGNGTGGESIWGKGFGTELDYKLVPYRGSLCMAMSSLPNSIGSQFFITQANYSDNMYNAMEKGGFPSGLLEQYKNYAGAPHLYMQYTVFGQVFEGLEIVDKIAKVETETTQEGQADKPVKDVIIEKVEVTTYSEN